MLVKEIYSSEYIKKLQQQYQSDPGLLERVVYAFGLLEALVQVKLPFIFKGGTSIMLLTQQPMRLSTDIDIIVPPGTDIDAYIDKASQIFPFKKKDEQQRKGNTSRIVKRHFKFIYESALQHKEFYILLDVVFMNNPYAKLRQTDIHNILLEINQNPLQVMMPTADCILGDKLTAFAPHTTGVLLGQNKELEILKQMFDISVLFDYMKDYQDLKATYQNVVNQELQFRDLKLSHQDVIRDTIQAALCVIGKGKRNAMEYKEYLTGIRALDSHVLIGRYTGETAAINACKVLYLASCLLQQEPPIYVNDPESYISKVLADEYKDLRYMRKVNPEGYAYLVKSLS